MSRTRTRITYSGTGTKHNHWGVLYGTSQNLASSETVSDLVARGDGHNFNVDRISVKGLTIKRIVTTGSTTGRVWVNWMLDRCRNPGDSMFNHLTVPDQPSDAILAADFLAKTNPSRPVVDLPIAVYELREIPRLLREEGNKILRSIAVGNLTYQFAIRPLVNDLLGLLNFSDEVAKRQKELEQLHEGGLRRKRHMWSGSNIAGPFDIIAQSGDKLIVHIGADYVTQRKIWAFTVWRPDNPHMMPSDMRDQARRAVLGLTIDFATAWNAIPWSWLVDWCGNIGDILTANRNIVGASPDPVQIMTQTTTSADAKILSYANDISAGSWVRESKQRRTLAYVPVDVQLPILNLRQLSILGSIGVTRRVPRSS